MVIERKKDLVSPLYEDLKRKIPIPAAEFLNTKIDWAKVEAPIFLREVPVPDGNVAAYRRLLEETENAACVVCLQRLNDVRYINKFLETVNRRLQLGGLLIGRAETSGIRRDRLMTRYPAPLNRAIASFDYFVSRVIPKLPHLKRLYFSITRGKNRAISEMEIYGRLYSCGFTLVDSAIVDGQLYFIAKKEKSPEYNMEATYGPLIRLRRVGKGGKLIKVYKLRTMYPYSEYLQAFVYERFGLGKGCKMKNDPRINAVGKFCRKYWLDELPMLINLLKGDVKIFGVRPISRHYFGLYPEEFQEYRKQFKPGLIPPVYVEIPETLEDVVDIERRYLQAYERQPLLTDLKYLSRIFYNILFKKTRSN